MTAFFTYRGQEDVAIEWRVVEDDPSTNAFEIEWYFSDEDMKGVEATAKEADEIETMLAERYFDPRKCDNYD